MNRTNHIFVTFQFEGLHCWHNAPPEVSFLRNLHRHLFCVRVEIKVFHDDRDIEFILFKRELQSLFSDEENVDHKSCEMICGDIADYIEEKYSGRPYRIEVSEDGENGAVLIGEKSEE